MIRQSSYDVIHAVEESVFLAARSPVPFVYDMDSCLSCQLRERSLFYWPAVKVFDWLETHALRRSLGVLAVCPALAEEARKKNANVHTFPDVALAGEQDGPLPEAIIRGAGVRLMYVGNLERYQGVDLMLEAFARVAPDRRDAALIVVGGEPARISAYQQKAERLGVGAQVRFAGSVPIDRISRVLRHADILVSPRIKGTNTPMKLYSYLLSSKPILATRLMTHTQVLSDECACLVEPTPEDMALGMRRLMDSPDLRERLGTAGRRLAETSYDRSAFQRRLERFYEQILR